LANRTLALHLPGGRQLFVTTGGALWTQQRSSGVCYKRRKKEITTGNNHGPISYRLRDKGRKLKIFPPRVFSAPAKGSLEFCNDGTAQKKLE